MFDVNCVVVVEEETHEGHTIEGIKHDVVGKIIIKWKIVWCDEMSQT